MAFTKEQQEILWSKDYDDFTFYDCNREIDYKHCEKKIQQSLLQYGWLKSFPMVVDGKLRIRDGQHRFLVAKQLGIPIPVLIVENFDDENMFAINNASKRWTLDDFVHYHMKKGDKNAALLYELSKKYNLSMRFLFELAHIDRHLANSVKVVFPNLSEKVLVSKIELINEILDVLRIKKKQERLRASLISFIENPRYNHQHFLKKLSFQLDKFHICTNYRAYVAMFQDIYNYKTSDKVIFTK